MSTTLSTPRMAGVSASKTETAAAWGLMALYAASRFLQVYPGRTPLVVVVGLHVVPPLIFTLLHGARSYGWRGIFTFVAISLVVGNLIEDLGVRTGFPFGHYYFTDAMGPKISVVPILLGLAYVGMAYLSWTLARLLLGGAGRNLSGWRVVTLPLVAAFVMVAWDLSQDPVWSTILHLWIWVQGGPYFGVPLSNFAGWCLDMYLIYQLFALYQWKRAAGVPAQPAGYWRQAVVFYALSAAGNLLLLIPRPGLAVVADATGEQWKVADITATCALVTVFTMGAFALLAWARAGEPD